MTSDQEMSAPPDKQASVIASTTRPSKDTAEEINATDSVPAAPHESAIGTVERAGFDSTGTYPDRQPSSSVAPSVSGTNIVA
jgi:hypothetical protein